MLRTRSIASTVFLCFTFNVPILCLAGEDGEKDLSDVQDFLETNCLDCHYSGNKESRLDIEELAKSLPEIETNDFDLISFEKIVRRLQSRQMPPPGENRPNENSYLAAIKSMDSLSLLRWKKSPQPGRTGTFRRLTRFEYKNAIRDLLGINVDVDQLLPKDESSHGFDNITVESLSPTLLTRYVAAAETISRIAIGTDADLQISKNIRLPADRSQEDHVPGLPFGTRGGTLFEIDIPASGEYEIQIKLARDRDEKVEGLDAKHELDVLIDRKRVVRFELNPPTKGKGWQRDFTHSDSHLRKRIFVEAGKHKIGVTFPKKSSSLSTIRRKPFDTNYNRHRHPRRSPAIFQVTLVGPLKKVDSNSPNSKARQNIFIEYPDSVANQNQAAKKNISHLMKRAYRRTVTEDDLTTAMDLFERAKNVSGFESGIELALASILVNPNFLFRIELEPSARSGAYYQINDFELASRLAFFLWSSLPDDRLLTLAEQGKLRSKNVLAVEVSRMLGDPKAKALSDNFASQWLQLKNLDSITPNLRLFPDFDDNLRHSFKQETKLLFNDIVENNKSVLNLIQSNYTYLDQRLATHYDIAGIKGSHFRKVLLPAGSNRGGILRHGSILTVTSYATRTSPTIRGNWILKNLLGTPPPPPPEDVPNLAEKSLEKAKTVRERLKIHRANPSCNSCHRLMDPIGFSLENYDAVGRWRIYDEVLDVDTQGKFPDGSAINNVADVESAIMKHPEVFAQTFTEKLLTYALGRGIQATDLPIVRQIVARASSDEFRFKSIVEEIVFSPLFQLRSIDK